MSEQRTCRVCREVKPLTAFALTGKGDQREQRCKECKALALREARAEQSQDERNAAQAAYRAGMRKDRCAVCASTIEGHGICPRCMDAIKVLGGRPDDLKRAAKALAYLTK